MKNLLFRTFEPSDFRTFGLESSHPHIFNAYTMHTHMHIRMRTCTRTNTRTHAHSHAHTHMYTHTQTHSHTHIRVRARTHSRTHAHSRARTHTFTHTHRRRRSGCRSSMGRWRPTVLDFTPLSAVPLPINGRSLFRSNKHTLEALGVFRVYAK